MACLRCRTAECSNKTPISMVPFQLGRLVRAQTFDPADQLSLTLGERRLPPKAEDLRWSIPPATLNCPGHHVRPLIKSRHGKGHEIMRRCSPPRPIGNHARRPRRERHPDMAMTHCAKNPRIPGCRSDERETVRRGGPMAHPAPIGGSKVWKPRLHGRCHCSPSML